MYHFMYISVISIIYRSSQQNIAAKYKQRRKSQRIRLSVDQKRESISVKQSPKLSQELNFQRELEKCLKELQRKEEDRQIAIEITESLSIENELLKEQIESLTINLQSIQNENDILKEKLFKISQSYKQDINKYKQELKITKELINDLKNSLNSKESNDNGLTTKLLNEIESQKEIINSLKNESKNLKRVKKEYNSLKHRYQNSMSEQIETQNELQNEVIYLASKQANLEQEKQDLLNLIDGRELNKNTNTKLLLHHKTDSRIILNSTTTILPYHGATALDDIVKCQNNENKSRWYMRDQEVKANCLRV